MDRPSTAAIFFGAAAKALACSCVVFYSVRKTLSPSAGLFDPIGGYADYFTLGISLLIFAVIYIRIRQGSWTREQDELIRDLDD